MPLYRGACRITVVSVNAAWPQRIVVTIRRGSTLVIPGTAGASELIDAEEWDIALEHEYEGEWRPNIRAVLGKWTDRNNVQSQLIYSKDADWTGPARNFRNLVLRIDRAGTTAPTPSRLVDAVRKPTESAITACRTTGTAAHTATPVSTQSGGAAAHRPATTSGQEATGQMRVPTGGRP
ncbi:hypothetical protein ACWD7F_34600 [Streptomyces sp. NPDC005122]